LTDKKDELINLLSCAKEVLGLEICLHLRGISLYLPHQWTTHNCQACISIKKKHTDEKCIKFDGRDTHYSLHGISEGRIQNCPYGFTEIACPVYSSGIYIGVIFAGTCWCKDTPAPYEGLIKITNQAWLEKRLKILKGIALSAGQIIEGEYLYQPKNRKVLIAEAIKDSIDTKINIDDIAEKLHLSKSRFGHLVKEIFGLTFPALVTMIKMKEAANYLISTDLPVAEIAFMLGFDDQNYFSRVFSKHFNAPPTKYRKENQINEA
jgi:AraC-like DNA-binding protein